jgi:hypothetical protein
MINLYYLFLLPKKTEWEIKIYLGSSRLIFIKFYKISIKIKEKRLPYNTKNVNSINKIKWNSNRIIIYSYY